MSRFLARQSRFLMTAFLLLTAAGVFSLLHLPVGLFPRIDFPRLAVSLEAGDRPADQMEAEVTRPAEQALRAVPGVRNIRSQTSRGSAEISLSFNWGADIITAALQSESELSKISPDLPAGFAFNVRRMDPTIFPVMGYSLTSDTQSPVELKSFALFTLRPMLASLDGVVEVSVLGGRTAEYEVRVDPVRLQALGLSVGDVEAAIQSSNVVAAAGKLIILAAVAVGLAWSHIASGFMPPMDEGGFVLDYVAPPGLSLTETDRLVTRMEDIIRSIPDVASYSRRTGVQLGGGLTEANEGDMFVRLKPFPRRPIDEVMAEVRRRVAETVPGLEIETIQLMGDLIGDLTAVPQPVEVKLYGHDPDRLTQAADQTVTALASVQGVVEVRKSDRVAGDALVITPDPAKMALEGLDAASVASQLEILVGGRPVGSILEGERSIDIRLWTPEGLRERAATLPNLMLRAPDGHLLPVKRIAEVEVVPGQPQSSRENLQPMTAVTGRLEGRDMGSAMRDVGEAMQGVSLPVGVRYQFGGLYAEQQKSFKDLTTVFAAAFLLSALLLLFLFRSPARAASILGVVGLSVAGVLVGLALTGTELNITAMMGLTMVIGIVAELGVFYFAELPEDHADPEDRIHAGHARLRPILMSALIAILALSPLALKIGQGAALLAPMAVAIISGLILGAPLVLLAAPVFDAALTPGRPHGEKPEPRP